MGYKQQHRWNHTSLAQTVSWYFYCSIFASKKFFSFIFIATIFLECEAEKRILAA